MSNTRAHATRTSRFGAALLALGIVAGGVVGHGATASAATPRTSSDVIAQHADRAVEALDRWQSTGNPTDFVLFSQHRNRTASVAASAVELHEGQLRLEWARVSIDKQAALLNAVSQLGVPYRSHRSDPEVGFDCSGLTSWAFGQAGMELPRISRDQINKAESVDFEQAEPGDLVYYPGHVSIYIGSGAMVHSPNSGNHVEITHLPSRSLRFGDAHAAMPPADSDDASADSLMDRTLAVSE